MFWKKKAPPVAPEPVSPLRLSISDVASGRDAVEYQPFTPARPAPGVAPDLAMDSCMQETTQWANSAFTDLMMASYAEGQQFLGYPRLAEMAQRTEYRVATETIATEMTRKWIKITATANGDEKAEKIQKINDEFDRLKVRDEFERAATLDGFFGRAHLYIDLGGTDDLSSSIGNGGEASKHKVKRIKALKVIEPMWAYPAEYDSVDPLADNFYRPACWYMNGKRVHETRLIPMVSREVPDMLKPAYAFGGIPLSQLLKPYVDNWLRTRQGVADLIVQFSVSVLKTQAASALFSGDNGSGLRARAKMFTNFRDNRGLYIIDKESEDFQNISTPLGTLDKLQAQAQEQMCSAARIPLVKFTGLSPSGLNASSEGEIRVFYDYISSYQQAFFAEPLTRILKFVQIALFGEVDPEIDFAFEPLAEMDPIQRSTIRKTDADTDAVLIDAGVISAEESRKRIADEEDSPYDALDENAMPGALPDSDIQDLLRNADVRSTPA